MENGLIGNWQIQQEQLSDKGYFSTGAGNEVILIMGSCRSAPYLNYLHTWNEQNNNNRFTVCFVDPFSWNFTAAGQRANYEENLLGCETNESLLAMLKSCKIFIHEYYQNAGMFNVTKGDSNNIYQFISPEIDVCIPNFNDVFILVADIVNFDTDIKYKATQDYNVIGKLSEQTIKDIDAVRERSLEKFYANCAKTSFPQFAEKFADNYKRERFFCNSNHVRNHFTLTIFNLIDIWFLQLFPTEDFWGGISKQDMYDNNNTYLTEYDLGYSWEIDGKPEEIKLLKEKL